MVAGGVLIRPMAEGDLEAVAGLCGQLGYPSTPAEVERRLGQIEPSNDDGLFVAQDARGRVVGWVHVHGRALLVSDPYAEIGGLVVDGEARGQGVGRALMARAEAWAAEHGYGEVRVRSNTVREGAHRFYQQLGYRLVKSQHVFGKSLRAPEEWQP